MPRILSCYYLDEALDEDELSFVTQALIGSWSKFRTGASDIQQKRVPAVLPLPDRDGIYEQSREERAEGVRANLRHAGVRADNGRQVIWVAPRDSECDAIFQFAIREETGFAPFVAQRQFDDRGIAVHGGLRVIDTQMLLSRL